MDLPPTLYAVSAVLVAGVGVLLLLSTRPGPSAWLAGVHLLVLGFATATRTATAQVPGWTEASGARASTALFLLAELVALAYTLRLRNSDRGRTSRWIAFTAACFAYVFLLLTLRPIDEPGGGLRAWFAERQGLAIGAFLLILSVWILANLEAVFRSAREDTRWELKWLFLGLSAPTATAVVSATRILLEPARPEHALAVVGLVALPGALFTFASWWRSKSRPAEIGISQSLAHSTLTFLSVGAYLSVASAASIWIGSRFSAESDMSIIVFAIAALGVGGLVLSGGMRARTREWVRRNLFRGTYDYRAFWISASESIRSEEPPDRSAIALARLVQTALDAQDVSVWLREDKDLLLACRLIDDRQESAERIPLPAALLDLTHPVAGSEAARGPVELQAFFERTQARIVSPFVCATDWLGVLCVGPSRSGRSYVPDSIEFLRVLAGYAARAFHSHALLELKVQAREDEAFRAFALFLLHDLKNFATTLSMVATNATQHAGNLEFRRDAFHSVLDTAERMKRLCNSLRSFSDAPRRSDFCSLSELIESVVLELPCTSRDHISLDLQSTGSLHLDREAIRGVLRNLLLNAEEAIGREGRIHVASRRIEDEVEIRIEDDGCGISEQYLRSELFTPFRTTKPDGLGIGLYQARRVLEAHGGSIRIESRLGTGTVARCRLPVS